jgi:hypothetical protein
MNGIAIKKIADYKTIDISTVNPWQMEEWDRCIFFMFLIQNMDDKKYMPVYIQYCRDTYRDKMAAMDGFYYWTLTNEKVLYLLTNNKLKPEDVHLSSYHSFTDAIFVNTYKTPALFHKFKEFYEVMYHSVYSLMLENMLTLIDNNLITGQEFDTFFNDEKYMKSLPEFRYEIEDKIVRKNHTNSYVSPTSNAILKSIIDHLVVNLSYDELKDLYCGEIITQTQYLDALMMIYTNNKNSVVLNMIRTTLGNSVFDSEFCCKYGIDGNELSVEKTITDLCIEIQKLSKLLMTKESKK